MNTKTKTKPVFSISLKVMAILTLLILLSLSTMIFFASFMFKDDIEIRIVENNHTTASIVASRITTDFSSIMKTANLISTSLLEGESESEQTTQLERKVFTNERDLIYIATAKKDGDSFKITNHISNESILNELGIHEDIIQKAVMSDAREFFQSFNLDQVVRNISPAAGFPLLGISVPLLNENSPSPETILIVCISPNSICDAVKSESITKTLIVNRNGDILAHEDLAMVLAKTNILRLPLVEALQTSTIDNGQLKYRDERNIEYLGSFKKINFGSIGVASFAEADKAFQSVAIIQRRNTLILIIVLNAALIVGFLFSKTLTNPIKRLVKSMREVEQGNFSYQITKIPRDELGLLMESFNTMNKGLQERETIKSAFGRFVNKDLAERLLHEDIKLGGERKKVTIFFSDIRSFTALSEKLEPEEVVSFLNEYLTLMVKCVNQNHGTVDKFIGDAIMAVWGTPVSSGNDAENSINSALLMRRTLITFNKDRGTVRRPRINIGCGINSGYVLAGQIGSQEKMDYTVIGDAVNLASRIEMLNKPFGTDILISEETHEEVKNIFNCLKMQKIMVKGKESAQQIWAVLGRKDDPSAPTSIKELREMVGIVFDSNKKIVLEEKKYSVIKNLKK